MEEHRQIRFLYPPFILFASLLLGIYLDPNMGVSKLCGGVCDGETSFAQDPGKIIGIIVGGGAVVIAFGFVISTISISFLRFLFLIRGCCVGRQAHFEATVSDSCLRKIWAKLELPGPVEEQKMLYAVVTYDHEHLPKPVHEWLRRRWSAFLISCHSVTALAIALAIGWLLKVALTQSWVITSIALMILFLWGAIAAWMGNMRMIELHSTRGKGARRGANMKSNRRAGVKPKVLIQAIGPINKTVPVKRESRGSQASQPRRSGTVSTRSRSKGAK